MYFEGLIYRLMYQKIVHDDRSENVSENNGMEPCEEEIILKKYGMTKKKIVHLIAESDQNGVNGFWYAACGKWIMPAEVTETVPDGGQMCLQCQKKML